MATIAESFDRLEQLLAEGKPDVEKAQNGNAAAGRRLRKVMMQVKSAAQETRKAVTEAKTKTDNERTRSKFASHKPAAGGDPRS